MVLSRHCVIKGQYMNCTMITRIMTTPSFATDFKKRPVTEQEICVYQKEGLIMLLYCTMPTFNAPGKEAFGKHCEE